jgi:hypothetical protein
MSHTSQIVIVPREKINFEKESLENTEADISSTPSPPKPSPCRRKLDKGK